jgi:hypothetical protein
MTCAPLFFVFRCCGFFSPARRAGDGKELKNDPKANCPENRAKTTHTLNHGVESRADDLAKPRKSVIFFHFFVSPLVGFFCWCRIFLTVRWFYASLCGVWLFGWLRTFTIR